MPVEIDHFFILTEPGSPQADLISAIGLVEGSQNVHPGQGTANRRFFLSNSTLELLYLRDVNESNNGPAKPLRFAERLEAEGASPFGLIFRHNAESSDPPFPGWPYCPEYFADDQCFHVGTNADLLEEPLCICMPPGLRPEENPPALQNADWSLTELRISVPVAIPSPTLDIVATCEGLSLQPGRPHHMDIVLNENREGRTLAMTPALPVTIHW